MKLNSHSQRLKRKISLINYHPHQKQKKLQSRDLSIGNLIERKYQKYCHEDHATQALPQASFSINKGKCSTALGFYEPSLKKQQQNSNKHFPKVKRHINQQKKERIFMNELGSGSPYKHQSKLLQKLTKVSPTMQKFKYSQKKETYNEKIIEYYKTKYGQRLQGQQEYTVRKNTQNNSICIDPW